MTYTNDFMRCPRVFPRLVLVCELSLINVMAYSYINIFVSPHDIRGIEWGSFGYILFLPPHFCSLI